MNSLSYPSVSFCPGYRISEDESNKIPWALSIHHWRFVNLGGSPDLSVKFPASEEESELAWESATYRIDEVLNSIVVFKENLDTAVDALSLNFSGNPERPADCVDVTEHRTLFGRCYTLGFHCGETIRVVDFVFNLSSATHHRGALTLHLHYHPENAILGLNNNYWTLPSKQVVVRRNEVSDVGVAKSVRIRHHGSTSSADYHECLRDVAREAVERGTRNGSGLCRTPLFDGLLAFARHPDAGSIELCDGYDSFMVAMRSVKRLLEHLNNNPSCAKPRTLVSYEVFPKEVLLPTGPMGGLSQVYVYYETTDVTMDQEYLLVDAGDLFSAAGGITGMLLGWSALDLVKIAQASLFGKKKLW